MAFPHWARRFPPTDAVAVGAIIHGLKVPRRFITVLNGESLMNDATGLVAFKFALAAVLAGTFSVSHGHAELSLGGPRWTRA